MTRMIFVTLPVRDLPRAIAFYEAVGATRNPTFSDDSGACMVWSDTIHAMLLTHKKYGEFTSKPIIDAKTATEVTISLSAASRSEVDDIVTRAGAAGGVTDPSPIDEHGFMYGRSFEDPDGHLWGIFWMDLEAAKTAMAK